MDHEYFMREALCEAKNAFNMGEVPVGAVLVHEGIIIARGHNLIEQRKDSSCHAELLCLQRGAEYFGNWRLHNTTLYCTLEPCAMCAGAMSLFRIKQLAYGAKDLRHGAHSSIFKVIGCDHPIHMVKVQEGILAKEAKALLQKFFRQRRKENARRTF